MGGGIGRPPPCLPAASGDWAPGLPCHPATHPDQGQGVTPRVPLPCWGGWPPHRPPITSYWQSRPGRGPGAQAGGPGISREGSPPLGPLISPGRAPRAGSGLCLPPAIAVATSRGRGREPMNERGAIGDTEILIRGSLWGGYLLFSSDWLRGGHSAPRAGPGATQLSAEAEPSLGPPGEGSLVGPGGGLPAGAVVGPGAAAVAQGHAPGLDLAPVVPPRPARGLQAAVCLGSPGA